MNIGSKNKNTGFGYSSKHFSLTFLSLIFCLSIFAETNSRSSVIRGTVKNKKGETLDYVTISIKDSRMGTTSDEDGNYFLRVVPGIHVLTAHLLGYATIEKEIEIKAGERMITDLTLDQDDGYELDKVEIVGQSVIKQINQTAYNVVALDAQALHNTTLDIAQALDRISGIKIKEEGGVGSQTQIFLNGFSGRHVKIFLDGVPMEGSGSSFRINNIPINLAERIEVYKGVVPIELGSDALGGAINIVTKNTANTFVDASYSYGSFNTHKSNISAGHTMKNGLTFQINAYQNYSDNSYKVKTETVDINTGKYTGEEQWYKRFHDMYHNEAIIGKVGIRNRPWATRMMFEFMYSQEKDEIQNSNIMKIVFGAKERKSKTISPSFTYEKRNLVVDNLNFLLTAKYNSVTSNNTDTVARQYSWTGEYRTKPSKGEGTYTTSETKNNSTYITANLSYRLGDNHGFSLNNVFSGFSRKATDNAANYETATETTFMKRKNQKNVTGLSYKFDYNRKWNLSAFAKNYNVEVTGPVTISVDSKDTYEERSSSSSAMGYGIATTYFMNGGWQVKGSFEKTYRMPTENELFGDELFEKGNSGLKPESSFNYNINLGYDHTFSKIHSVYTDIGIVYRNTRDYIRREIGINDGNANNTNHGKVRTFGLDLETRYFYSNKFSVGGTFTWQDMRNMEKYEVGGIKETIYYKDRMPYVPYLFTNIDAAYNFYNIAGKSNFLSLGYNLHYIHKFFRSWESEGGNIHIPSQLSHDFSVNYAIKNGQYNIALEAKNITDEILYDNYSLQKPGRAFYIKLRYFFSKINQ